MTELAALIAAVASGFMTVFSYGNIALSLSVLLNGLLVLCCYVLIKIVIKSSDKTEQTNDVLTAVNRTLGELNKRIDHD